MKTALLYFAIWLIGALISAFVIFRALRAKCTASMFDYAMGFCASLLSWVFLIPVIFLYIVSRCEALGNKMEKMWQKMDDWCRSKGAQ